MQSLILLKHLALTLLLLDFIARCDAHHADMNALEVMEAYCDCPVELPCSFGNYDCHKKLQLCASESCIQYKNGKIAREVACQESPTRNAILCENWKNYVSIVVNGMQTVMDAIAAAIPKRFSRLSLTESAPFFAPSERNVSGSRVGIFVAYGQSNSDCFGSTGYTTKHPGRVLQFFDGKTYEYKEPMLGASGRKGTFLHALFFLISHAFFFKCRLCLGTSRR